MDRILANRGAGNGELALLDELCDTMANGSLCGLGGLTPFPVRSALKYFPEDFRLMYAKGYHDLGTPAASGAERTLEIALEIDGVPITVPAGTSIMRAAALVARDVPKLCATDTLKAFGSCRVCLVEIEGRKGFPASCTTEVAAGMKVRTASDALTKLRRGVLELYVSEHPMGTCPDSSRCELEIAGGGARHCRIAFRGRGDAAARSHSETRRRQQSILPLRQRPVHRLLALRARLRRHAGNLRAHHRGPRHRVARLGFAAAAVPGIRVCFLRRLRRSLSNRGVDGEVRHHRRPAATVGRHDLRLLWSWLRARRRDHRWRGVAHGAQPEWTREPGSCLREGPLCLWLRDAYGSRDHAR